MCVWFKKMKKLKCDKNILIKITQLKVASDFILLIMCQDALKDKDGANCMCRLFVICVFLEMDTVLGGH